MKTFEVGSTSVETRFLVREDDTGWQGYSYLFQRDGSEARLVNRSANGVPAEERRRFRLWQTDVGNVQWRYPSQTDCAACHGETNAPLGFQLTQLDGNVTGPDESEIVDQLTVLSAAGVLDLSALSIVPTPLVASRDNPSATLTERVKSYLDANCSSCHQGGEFVLPNGIAIPLIDLRFETPLAEMRLCKSANPPSRERIPDVASDAQVVYPGQPELSTLLARIEKTFERRESINASMPPLGKTVTDREGAYLLYDWISQLDAADVCP